MITRILIVIALFFSCSLANSEACAVNQPNIVLFLVDDMGWQDTSVPFWTKTTKFNEKYHTPNMEQLAADGMKFTQAYASCVCSPTRVSLMTGLNAARHRVTNWTLRPDNSHEPRSKEVAAPNWNYNGISNSPDTPNAVFAPTLPKLLKDVGYRTIHVGKAHFGAISTPGAEPKNLGFDVNIAGHAAGGPGGWYGDKNFGNDRPGPWGIPGLEKYHGKRIHLTEALTLEANAAVEQAVKDGKQFYLYMSHYAIHAPIREDDRFINDFPHIRNRTEKAYATMIKGMDKSLGDIMAKLDALNVANNTIVIFMSDNGGLSAHARAGNPHTHNKPLSSGKGSAHEGGVRVPMIVKWPSVTAARSKCEQPVIIEDFFTSILHMANHPEAAKHEQRVDGENFVPLLYGKKQTQTINKQRALYWHYPNFWGPSGPGIGAHSAMRKANWKLIYYHATRRYELFNLKDDIGETNNLADVQTDLRDRMANQLRDYLISVEAQMPTDRASGEVIPLPGTPKNPS